MSNNKIGRNATVNGNSSAKSLEGNRSKNQQEEFASEFEFDAAAAQVNNFAETQGKTNTQQPISERTAWH